MKGIVLAGGEGTRLHPLTISVSKQLLPVYNKPLVFYPLSVLMRAGIRDILIITTPHDKHLFEKLLGDGSNYGLNLTFMAQPKPEGLAQAFLLGEDFIGPDPVCLVLGDNLFHTPGFDDMLTRSAARPSGGTVFAVRVPDPERYGVVGFDAERNVTSIEEKPDVPKSDYAVTGLYFYDNDVVSIAKLIKPSHRGQLEITSVNAAYLEAGSLNVELMDETTVWLDAGTHTSLLEAGNTVLTLEAEQNVRLGYLEAIAWQNGWIDKETLSAQARKYGNSGYGKYLASLTEG